MLASHWLHGDDSCTTLNQFSPSVLHHIISFPILTPNLSINIFLLTPLSSTNTHSTQNSSNNNRNPKQTRIPREREKDELHEQNVDGDRRRGGEQPLRSRAEDQVRLQITQLRKAAALLRCQQP